VRLGDVKARVLSTTDRERIERGTLATAVAA